MNKHLIFVTHLQPKIKPKIHQINFMIEFVFFYSFVIFVNILGFNTIHVVTLDQMTNALNIIKWTVSDYVLFNQSS